LKIGELISMELELDLSISQPRDQRFSVSVGFR